MNLSKFSKLCAGAIAVVLAFTTQTMARGVPLITERALVDFPVINLTVKQAGGQDAIRHLGSNLDAVAKWYGHTPGELQSILMKDKHLRVDQKGRLFVVDTIEGQQSSPVIGDTISIENTTQFLEQTFFLHSRPGAKRTIYLDFNGATITGTAWNSNGNTINAVAYDIDGNPSTFSSSELQRIQYIWQRVAEDYAPFDVDVTTEQPPAENLVRASSTDEVYGTTVVITKTAGVYTCDCGGVAYIGVFSNTGNYYKPALVFYDKLASGNEKSVAEAISHEVGHNVGLQHDGTSTTTYYGGHGTSKTTSWAPIMGVGYYKPVVQFSAGEYADANNTEDDFSVMRENGLPLRPDDNGNTFLSATPFSSGTSVHDDSIDGVIEFSTDRDVFSVTAGAGTLTTSVIPATRSPNLDLVITLIAPNGQVLATANPTDALPATITFNVPTQGTYFIEVRGGNPGTSPLNVGYSDYGSVGNYRLSVLHAPTVGTEPVAKITTTVNSGTAPLMVTLDGSGSIDDGKVSFWYWDFGDGSSDHSGSMVVANHTYAVAGTYYAKLTVVDDTGLQSSTVQTITVTSPLPYTAVQSIPMTHKHKRTGWYAIAPITVVNQNGQRVRATVSATWSGVVGKTIVGRTNKSGLVSFKSPVTPAAGCAIVTITDIQAPGYVFDKTKPVIAQLCSDAH